MRKRFPTQATAVFPLVLAALAGSSLTASPELADHVGKAHIASGASRHTTQSVVKHSRVSKPSVISSTRSLKQNASAGASGFNFTPEQRKDYGEMMRLQSASGENVKLGDADAELENWSRAATYYQEALNIWPQDTQALYGLGQCAAATGNLTLAVRYYHTAVYVPSPNTLNVFGTVPGDGFQTNDVKRLMEFALLLNRAGQVQEAVFIYNRAADLMDYERGDVLHGDPNLKVLLPELTTKPVQGNEVSYTPEHLQALAQTALAYKEMSFGSSKEAIAHMQESVKLYPDSPVTHYYLGEALPSGSPQEKVEYKKAADLGDDKTSAAAKERLSMYP